MMDNQNVAAYEENNAELHEMKQVPRKEDRIVYSDKNDDDIILWEYLKEINRGGIKSTNFFKRCALHCMKELQSGNLKFPF